MEKFLNFFKRKKRSEDLTREDQLKKAVKILKKKGMDFENLLGSGTFGDVLKFHDSKHNMKKAVKMIRPEKTSEGELLIWPELDHPNVIPLEKIIRTAKVDLFVMPLHNQALDTILRDQEFQSNPKSFQMSVGWLRDILTALEYLHGRNNCHMDLKSNNVLISNDMKAIVCDFSCLNVTTEPVGHGLPTLYCPPEAFQKFNGKTPKLYGIPFDVWSCGMLALCMWTKWYKTTQWHTDSWREGVYQALFQTLKPPCFRRFVKRSFCQAHLSQDAVRLALNFIQSTLRYDPLERPKTTVLLQHGLFAGEPGKKLPPDLMWTICNEFRDKSTSKVAKSKTYLENCINIKSLRINEEAENKLPLGVTALGSLVPSATQNRKVINKDMTRQNEVNDKSYSILEKTANGLPLSMTALNRSFPTANHSAKVTSERTKPDNGVNDIFHGVMEEPVNQLPLSMVALGKSLPNKNQNTNILSKGIKFKNYSEGDANVAFYRIMEKSAKELPLSMFSLNRLLPSANLNEKVMNTDLKPESVVNDTSHRIMDDTANELPLSMIAVGRLHPSANQNKNSSPGDECSLELGNKDFKDIIFLQDNTSVSHVAGAMHEDSITANELSQLKSHFTADFGRQVYSKSVEIDVRCIIQNKTDTVINNEIKLLLKDNESYQKPISGVPFELSALKLSDHSEIESCKEMTKISNAKNLRPVDNNQCKSERIGIKKRIRNWFHKKLSVLTRSKRKK